MYTNLLMATAILSLNSGIMVIFGGYERLFFGNTIPMSAFTNVRLRAAIFNVMLVVIMLIVIMLIVVMLIVIMLVVVMLIVVMLVVVMLKVAASNFSFLFPDFVKSAR